MGDQIDDILNRISLAFGIDTLELVFPEDLLVELTLFRISKIDVAHLDDEMAFHSKIYMLFENISSHVSDKYNRVEALLKQLESQLAIKYEKHLVNSGDRVSDKKIEKLVDADPDYIDAVNRKLQYKNLVTTFNNILRGLDVKHDMLVQLAAKRNKEIGNRMT